MPHRYEVAVRWALFAAQLRPFRRLARLSLHWLLLPSSQVLLLRLVGVREQTLQYLPPWPED
jgi:hypothetical protein